MINKVRGREGERQGEREGGKWMKREEEGVREGNRGRRECLRVKKGKNDILVEK